TYLTAPYFINPNSEYDSFARTFANRVGGYTVEMVIMCVGGYAILYLATNYFRTLIEKYKDLRKHEEKIEEHTKIMDSMAGIYDNANMIDFERMTERNIASGDKGEMKIDLSIQDHTSVTRSMFDSIVNDQLKDFIKFTDITTVQKRLENKKAISGEFIDILKGWFRAQYIVLNTDESGFPTRVIFTSQNIDNEKRREEHLIRIAMTDELTRLYNRRCYEEDIAAHKARGLEKDLSIFSIDVNGLKTANDTKGHAAGDELIKGAADCLVVITGSKGKVYRTGGDEFVAIINTDDCEKIKSQMKAKAAAWHGVYSEKLAISIGFASVADNQEATMEDLEKIADQMMYEDKAAYYSQNGIDRRRR
ncbi:MAG: GGDEF domain-containing protein, partial [Butyrivibrio sp.]|uniref:GGDEF domain-containing protein n=1 Tax=Butyrivibrio sp. TaxID=28121 RepID=UPI0025FBEEA7